MAVLIYHNYKTADADAIDALQIKAWSGAGIVTDGNTGGFVAWANKRHKEDDGYVSGYGSYGVEFDTSSTKLKVQQKVQKGETSKKKTWDLDEKVADTDKAPRKYWFWTKVNKHASSGATYYWNTLWYIGTLNPLTLKKGVYDTKQWEKDGDWNKIDRYTILEGGLFKKFPHNSGAWGPDGYAIDISDWYDEAHKQWWAYNGIIRLHTVAEVTNGSHYYPDLYTSKLWKEAGPAVFPSNWQSKYNQWVQVQKAKTQYLYVYKVETENNDSYPTKAEMSTDGDYVLDKVHKGKIKDFSLLDTTSIKTYKDDETGDKYYLAGIRVQHLKNDEDADEDNDDDWEDAGHFYIEETSIIGTDSKTSKYSKKGSSYSGTAKDTFGEKTLRYDYSYKFKYKNNKFSKTDGPTAAESTGGDTFDEPKTLTGKHTYEELLDYMLALKYRSNDTATRICLVYVKAEKATVTLQSEYYDWSENETKNDGYVKVEADTTKKRLGIIDSTKSSGDFKATVEWFLQK